MQLFYLNCLFEHSCFDSYWQKTLSLYWIYNFTVHQEFCSKREVGQPQICPVMFLRCSKGPKGFFGCLNGVSASWGVFLTWQKSHKMTFSMEYNDIDNCFGVGMSKESIRLSAHFWHFFRLSCGARYVNWVVSRASNGLPPSSLRSEPAPSSSPRLPVP